MILINTLTKSPPDINYRIFLRNQLNASGMQTRTLPKLEALDYHFLNIQIDAYKLAAENDLEEAFGDELSMYSDVSQPAELFDILMEQLSDSPQAAEHLSSTFRSMLLVKGDPEAK